MEDGEFFVPTGVREGLGNVNLEFCYAKWDVKRWFAKQINLIV